MNALATAWQKNDSLLCVGLDPDPTKIPPHLKDRPDAIFAFCKAIIDATSDLVCCFKPQIAYFAAQRAEDQLEALIADRAGADPASSYVAKLLAAPVARRAQKVGEEGVETALAAVAGDAAALRGEAADLLFHLLVLLRGAGLELADVVGELAQRHQA